MLSQTHTHSTVPNTTQTAVLYKVEKMNDNYSYPVNGQTYDHSIKLKWNWRGNRRVYIIHMIIESVQWIHRIENVFLLLLSLIYSFIVMWACVFSIHTCANKKIILQILYITATILLNLPHHSQFSFLSFSLSPSLSPGPPPNTSEPMSTVVPIKRDKANSLFHSFSRSIDIQRWIYYAGHQLFDVCNSICPDFLRIRSNYNVSSPFNSVIFSNHIVSKQTRDFITTRKKCWSWMK